MHIKFYEFFLQSIDRYFLKLPRQRKTNKHGRHRDKQNIYRDVKDLFFLQNEKKHSFWQSPAGTPKTNVFKRAAENIVFCFGSFLNANRVCCALIGSDK